MRDRRLHPNQFFHSIWQRFNANMGSLWLFSQQITQMADKLDREKVHEIALELASLFDDDPVSVESELLEFLPSLDNLDIYPNFFENPNVRETFEFLQSSDFKKHILEWARENPKKGHKLADIFTTYFSEPPANGILLRRSAFVSLVSFLELICEELFFAYYYYTDLELDINSDEHKEKAHKKADKEMHTKRGWIERIENFQKLGIKLGVAEKYIDELTEIAHRRNLIVHNNGVIDEGYMNHAPEKYRPQGAETGQVLIVSTRYLMRAFSVVNMLAFALNQACWRQWTLGKNHQKANNTFENFIYATLRQERYEFVTDLVGICADVDLPARHEQFVKANYAIALRELGEADAVNRIVSNLSHSNPEWRVRIALAILRNDKQKSQLLLARAGQQGKLIDISRYWPLFKPLLNELWFQRIFDAADHGQIPKKH